MKNKLFIVLLLLLIFPSAFALSLDTKPQYAQAETLIARIQGEILEPITRDRVELLRNGYLQVPVEYEIQKIGDDYFLYMVMPRTQNNYTIVMHDVATTVNGRAERIELRQNISTTNETIPYTIKPGFFMLRNDAQLTLILNQDREVTIALGAPLNRQLTLRPGENSLPLSASNFLPGSTTLTIGLYNIPLYIAREITLPQPGTPMRSMRFFPNTIDITILTGETYAFPFRIANTGTEEIRDLAPAHGSDLIIITPSRLARLLPNTTAEFNVSVKNHSEAFSDKIYFVLDNNTYELPVVINYTKKREEIRLPYLQNYTQQGKYCNELNGTFCPQSYTCSDSLVPSLNGNCCIGTCAPPKKISYAWVGYLIALIILVGIIILGGRYLKRRGQKKIFNQKVSSLESKFTPS